MCNLGIIISVFLYLEVLRVAMTVRKVRKVPSRDFLTKNYDLHRVLSY